MVGSDCIRTGNCRASLPPEACPVWIVGVLGFASATAYSSSRPERFSWTLARSAFVLIGALEVQTRGATTQLDTSIVCTGKPAKSPAMVVREGSASPLGEFSESRAPRLPPWPNGKRIASAHPQWAVISAGTGNSFHVPELETLAPVTNAGAPCRWHRSGRGR